jgi:hypothetical protein
MNSLQSHRREGAVTKVNLTEMSGSVSPTAMPPDEALAARFC